MQLITVEQWNPPTEESSEEFLILKLCKKQKLWGFLRKHRHEILNDEVRGALRRMYANGPRGGRPPLAPERLALAMLLQVGFGVADHEVPTLTAVDRRWQMVLDCLGTTTPLMSQGTVFSFRERAREHGLMSLLLARTTELARTSKGFSHKRLRAIFDSSPLVGAGRVEDTFNLLGRAIAQLAETAAAEGEIDANQLAEQVNLSVVSASSVKAALDVDWREPDARSAALCTLLEQFRRLRNWLEQRFGPQQLEQPPFAEHIELIEQLIEQDTEPDPDAPTTRRRIRKGVAKDRVVSLSDRDMRHGRKSRTKAFSGYKRHIAADADVPGLICAVEVQPANQCERDAAAPLMKELTETGYDIAELHIDRGYLTAEAVVEKHAQGVPIVSKPPSPVRGEYFDKSQFDMDFDAMTVTCPAGATVPLQFGKPVAFPQPTCRACELRPRCTKSRQRRLSIHVQERWYRDMARELATASGRAKRRQRTQVEHALAHVSAIQGNRARFRGLSKNRFDLQRTAVVNNCYVLNDLWASAA